MDMGGSTVEQRIRSDDIELAAHIARPPVSDAVQSALVLCHGYPSAVIGAKGAGSDLAELADRIAESMDWLVVSFTFRGCGTSGGQFSLAGWIRDIVAAVQFVGSAEGISQVWLAGFGTGGGLCINAADVLGDKVLGVAALGAPAGFDDWAGHTRRLMQHSRDVGVISDPSFPPAPDAWAKEFRTIRPVDAATHLADRPMLVIHGSEDEIVPVFDARVLADAHGSAELRIIPGADHGVRYDPRAIAVLLGWLDRENGRQLRRPPPPPAETHPADRQSTDGQPTEPQPEQMQPPGEVLGVPPTGEPAQ